MFDGQLDQTYAVAKPDATTGTIAPAKRLAIYEVLQELHRRLERPRVLISADLPAVLRHDFADLSRVEITIADPRDPPGNASWDCVVAPKGAILAPTIQPTLLVSV